MATLLFVTEVALVLGAYLIPNWAGRPRKRKLPADLKLYIQAAKSHKWQGPRKDALTMLAVRFYEYPEALEAVRWVSVHDDEGAVRKEAFEQEVRIVNRLKEAHREPVYA